MIHPPRLRAGDVVRLIAPSGPVPRDAFQSGVAVLKQRYEVRFDEALFAREGFLAGPDERRLGELAAALGDADTRAIVMARGGYGLMRLLPFIDPDLLPRCWRSRRGRAWHRFMGRC
jgi:muramoyltetrapeptide carboxypeptidase